MKCNICIKNVETVISLKTTSATRIYTNLDILETHEMIKMYNI
jgi:hypothetical protein